MLSLTIYMFITWLLININFPGLKSCKRLKHMPGSISRVSQKGLTKGKRFTLNMEAPPYGLSFRRTKEK